MNTDKNNDKVTEVKHNPHPNYNLTRQRKLSRKANAYYQKSKSK